MRRLHPWLTAVSLVACVILGFECLREGREIARLHTELVASVLGIAPGGNGGRGTPAVEWAGPAGTPADRSYGPAAALRFARQYRGDAHTPDVQYCYPDAVGVPLADCRNIIPMTAELWTPAQISADFRRRMGNVDAGSRKKGIIVVLKTERCATKWLRACTVTTAALEKRSSPLASEFLIYALLLKPRDGDDPPGSRKIETGPDPWKNDAAGEYHFRQGPGATLAFLDPSDGSRIESTDAVTLRLYEEEFLKNEGRTPELHAKLAEILERLRRRPRPQGS